MDVQKPKWVITWKKYGDPITAVSIILFFIFAYGAINDDLDLKREIKNSCGWAEEDYRCMCERSEVIAIENKIKNAELGNLDLEIGVLNVTFGGEVENDSLVE